MTDQRLEHRDMTGRTTISISDAGSYFRGLLVLARKDRKVTDAEIGLIKRIGRSLGLATEFCENAIRDLLENEHIPIHPRSLPRRQ
jgi:hypothetical protein